jgi:hypothetical protein
MSGKPNSTEVEALRLNLRRMREIADSNARSHQIVAAQKASIEKLNEEYTDLAKKSLALLTGMDVSDSQRGNYGWEARQLWFLQELTELSELHGNSKS